MAQVLTDTSAVYALLDRSDGNHATAAKVLKALGRGKDRPILTNFLVAEIYGLAVGRLGRSLAFRWLDGNRWPIERVREEDERRAREILCSYEDKDFSFVDATSFAVMERLHVRCAFAFDEHFSQFGFDRAGDS